MRKLTNGFISCRVDHRGTFPGTCYVFIGDPQMTRPFAECVLQRRLASGHVKRVDGGGLSAKERCGDVVKQIEVNGARLTARHLHRHSLDAPAVQHHHVAECFGIHGIDCGQAKPR